MPPCCRCGVVSILAEGSGSVLPDPQVGPGTLLPRPREPSFTSSLPMAPGLAVEPALHPLDCFT